MNRDPGVRGRNHRPGTDLQVAQVFGHLEDRSVGGVPTDQAPGDPGVADLRVQVHIAWRIGDGFDPIVVSIGVRRRQGALVAIKIGRGRRLVVFDIHAINRDHVFIPTIVVRGLLLFTADRLDVAGVALVGFFFVRRGDSCIGGFLISQVRSSRVVSALRGFVEQRTLGKPTAVVQFFFDPIFSIGRR